MKKITISVLMKGGWAITCAMISFTGFSQKKIMADIKPELLFQSGFEGTTKIVPDKASNDYGAYVEYFTGIDNTLKEKNDWDKDWGKLMNGGHMQVQYTGGDSTKRYAKVVPEPGNPSNKVLKFWLDGSWSADLNVEKARVQTNIYGLKEGLKEFYQSVRVFMTDDFSVLSDYPRSIRWLTLSEFWNNAWWVNGEKYGFRTGLVAGKLKPEDKELYFLISGEDSGQVEVWRTTNDKVKVPIGKWFTMEYYYKDGDSTTGRIYLAITPEGGKKQVVYDVHRFTHNTKNQNSDGFTDYNPMKLYTSPNVVAFVKSKGKTLQIYWDDFRLWKNKRPD